MSHKSKPDKAENVKVVVRCRPLNRMEQENSDPAIVSVNAQQGSVICRKPDSDEKKQFTFDCAFPPNTSQIDVFSQTAKIIVDSVLGGYNGTIFAYGQTGTGKTFTMEGDPDNQEQLGIMPRSFHYVVDAVSAAASSMEFLVRVSFLEIYKDDVYDLLNKQARAKLDVKESKDRGVFVKGLAVYNVKSVAEMMKCLRVGQNARKTGATKMNEGSSRSHSIFTITIESSQTDEKGSTHYKVGKLNLVDLAGSERQKKTEATGERLDEAKSINWSLTVLGNCIKALIDPHATHIPYRDSKLTRLLQDSLGGNTKTVMIANIGPAASNFEETVATLRYADRAKQIKNKPSINEDPKDAMLRSMQEEIARLKAELAARAGGGGVGGNLSALTALMARAGGGGNAVTLYGDGRGGDDETMVDISQLPRELIEERIVEKVVIRDTGISEEEIKKLEGKTQEEIDTFLREKEREKNEMKVHANLAEQATKQMEEALQKKEEMLNKEQEALQKLSVLLGEKEKALLVGGQQLDKAQAQKLELQATETELQKRRTDQNKLIKELKEAEEAELYMNQHYSSIQEEIQVKTSKLKKLWTKYQEKKTDYEELQEEFNVEREDLIDTIRSLDRQLKLKNLLLDNFIPITYLSLIEKNAHYDTNNDQWTINGIEYAGNMVQREDTRTQEENGVNANAASPGGNGGSPRQGRRRRKFLGGAGPGPTDSGVASALIHAHDLNIHPLGLMPNAVPNSAQLMSPADRPVYFSYQQVLNNANGGPAAAAGQTQPRPGRR